MSRASTNSESFSPERKKKKRGISSASRLVHVLLRRWSRPRRHTEYGVVHTYVLHSSNSLHQPTFPPSLMEDEGPCWIGRLTFTSALVKARLLPFSHGLPPLGTPYSGGALRRALHRLRSTASISVGVGRGHINDIPEKKRKGKGENHPP